MFYVFFYVFEILNSTRVSTDYCQTCISESKLVPSCSCQASSVYQNADCTNAFDGDFKNTDSSVWASDHEGVGAWIEILFDDIYRIDSTRIMQRRNTIEQFETVEISFDGVPTEQVSQFLWLKP